MSTPGYLRQPSIGPTGIVFVCDDDLWTVSADGGVARRLTAGLGEPSTPALSPDGQSLAYVSRDEAHPEVYLMPAEGGPARRMSWLGPDVQVRGFTPDGKILFVSTYGQPFFRNYRAFALALDGGLPEELRLGQVDHLSFGTNGRRVIGRNTTDPARWKRYRGGRTGHLWVDAHGDGNFHRLSELQGNLSCPMWIGERIYFLGDAEGMGNLYSCAPDGSALRRHTDHDAFYARTAATDGKRIVYACGADLWLFDIAGQRARKLEIDVPAHRTQAARRFVAAADHLHSAALHPDGHSIAVDVRGKLATAALWEGAVRQLGAAEPGRLRHAAWLADGTTLVATCDSSGEERLVVFDGSAMRVIDGAIGSNTGNDIGRVIALAAAPRGTRVALANHRNEVLLIDVASGATRVLDRSPGNRVEELAWSPDGAWLAYPFWPDIRRCAIKLAEVQTGATHVVTAPDFRDSAPAFDPDGKYLYFVSVRTFDPVYDNASFDLSFPRAARPYLIALQADAKPPFEPAPKGFGAGSNDDKKKDAAVPPLRIDLDGIAQRVAAFPVPEGRYGRIAGVGRGDNARVLWSVFPIPGAHGRGGHKDAPARLECFEYATGKTETWLEAADSFEVGRDAATVLVREGKTLRALDGTKKPEAGGTEPSRKTGWIDLARVRVDVDPRVEWRQMFREVWRLQRDQFWVADMSGVDWDAVYARYAPLVDRVSTRSEFSDLVWELHGELGTSHAYEWGGDHRRPPAVTLGHLGADFDWTKDGYTIARLVRGDPWDAAADSPLNAVGVHARVGERIAAVNGVAVTRETPPPALLVHRAGQKVELRLASAAGTRDVLVTALSDEVPARYREWVERNRTWVHDKSGGRCGYLHLPDMQAAGFAEFHRYFPGECDRAALIVDVRYNRGGHVSQLLLEKLARHRIGYDLSRHNPPQPYPGEARFGPCVALTNEHAGSDGDIFSHCFKLMKLGPLVGKRTWGGVIGIWPRHKLADGSETTQPEFSFWFEDVGFTVENYGTDPDIDIDNAPQDAAAGRDAQLEKALAVALAEVERTKPALPDFGPRPNLARPALPKRIGT
jgi:tricorn protease